MENQNYKATIEAILFANGEPISLSRIAEVLELDTEFAMQLMAELVDEYEQKDGGLRILRLENAYQMTTAKAYADEVRRAMDLRRNTPLSQAAMEVLAIVAYNQPVTKAFVEQVRGVDCSAVIQGLMTKNLVEERGRLELPGHPLLYGTTAVFLRCFGLDSIKQLPPLPQSETGGVLVETTLDEIIEAQDQETQE